MWHQHVHSFYMISESALAGSLRLERRWPTKRKGFREGILWEYLTIEPLHTRYGKTELHTGYVKTELHTRYVKTDLHKKYVWTKLNAMYVKTELQCMLKRATS